MKISRLFQYTSQKFRMENVVSEVKELLHARTKSEVLEEAKDVVTTALLLLYARTGIDMWIPSSFTSAGKYIDRMNRCREVLKEEGIYDSELELRTPIYFARYTEGGSNMDRPEKRAMFIREARKHMQSNKEEG